MGKIVWSAKTIMIMVGIVAGIAITITACILIFSNNEESYRIIKVFEAQGTSEVTREKEVMDTYAGMALESGDNVAVSTVEGDYLRLSLDSDKYILAETGTKFMIEATGDEENSNTKITLMEGALNNDISNKLSAESTYEVNTPNATMFVRGTNWRVWIEKDENGKTRTYLLVLDGCVEVYCIQPDGSIDQVGNKVNAGEAGVIICGDKTYFESGTFEGNDIPDYVVKFWQELLDEGRPLVIPEGTDVVSANQSSSVPGMVNVTFKYGLEGELSKTVSVAEGADAVTPSAAEIEVTGYDFTGWDGDYTQVSEDTVVTASYEAQELNHTVCYYTKDGWTSESVLHTYSEEDYNTWTPQDSAYACAGLEFTGWETTSGTGLEKTFTAQYRAKVSFVIDGTTVTTTYVKLGEELPASDYPAIPSKTGYSQTTPKWDIPSMSEVTQATTITAIYTKDQYDVTFAYRNSQGQEVTSVVKVGYMEAATAPDDTTINSWYGHKFLAWNATFNQITSNLTVTATYETLVYNIVFPTNKEGYELIGEHTGVYGVTYSFTIKVLAGYTQSKPLVRVNGTILNSAEPRYVGSEVLYDYSMLVTQDMYLDVTGLYKNPWTVTLNCVGCTNSIEADYYCTINGSGNPFPGYSYEAMSTKTIQVSDGGHISLGSLPSVEGSFVDNWNEISQMTITGNTTITVQYRSFYSVTMQYQNAFYMYFVPINTDVELPSPEFFDYITHVNYISNPYPSHYGVITGDLVVNLPEPPAPVEPSL